MLHDMMLCDELFHTPSGVAFADFITDGHRETCPIRTSRLSGSTWSYCRCARLASNRACSSAFSTVASSPSALPCGHSWRLIIRQPRCRVVAVDPEPRYEHTARSAGVVGSARRKGGSGNWGRPVRCEGSGLNVASRRRHWRESDRVIRPLKPGNAGGGKDPDFRG